MLVDVHAVWSLIGGIVWLVFLCFLACSKSPRGEESFFFFSLPSKMTVFLINKEVYSFPLSEREKYGLSFNQSSQRRNCGERHRLHSLLHRLPQEVPRRGQRATLALDRSFEYATKSHVFILTASGRAAAAAATSLLPHHRCRPVRFGVRKVSFRINITKVPSHHPRSLDSYWRDIRQQGVRQCSIGLIEIHYGVF